MRKILLVGTNEITKDIIAFTADHPGIKLYALYSKSDHSFMEFVDRHHIQTFTKMEQCKHHHFDYIFLTDSNEIIEKQLMKDFANVEVISVETIKLLHAVITKRFQFTLQQLNEFQNVRTMLDSIRDGIIVIDAEERIQFMNDAAATIIGCDKHDVLTGPISHLLPNSRLPIILQTQQKEVNVLFKISEDRSIVTTRIPLFNENNHLIGAFAIFKDHEEVLKLAEENTNLKELQMMLEALIHASGEAISVVDENGRGLLFNSAYTKLTGLRAEEVIGKPATIDILEGESIHLQVIQKRRAIHGVPMKIGKHHTDVIVNASPIIVSGKIRGSIAVIHDVSHIKQLSGELKRAKQMIRNLESSFTFNDVIGHSTHIQLAIQQAKIAANSSVVVLLKGENGSGKELFAHAIHNESERKYNKFIRVNCTNLHETIIEGELFGYEETNVMNKKSIYEKGVFEEANYGTVFIDEIAHLPLRIQEKLVHVIEEEEMVRMGGNTAIPLDVKIIAASSISLEEKVAEGTFHRKLYEKLHTLPIVIPPLRERMEDLYELVQLIIVEKNELYGRNVQHISSDALYELKHYDWPGNVRELENVIDRAIIFMKQSEATIQKNHLPILQTDHQQMEKQQTSSKKTDFNSLQDAVESFEQQYIGEVYRKNNFNKSKTAKELRISLRNLYYKIEKYQIEES